MATTQLSDLINPQVMADMISAKVAKKLVVTPFAKVDTTLQGVPGNTVTVPQYAYIGDAEDIAEGVAVGAVKLTTSTTNVTVKKAMKAVELTDEAVLSGYGNPVGETNNQLAKAIASKVDNDAMDALLGAQLVHDGTAADISYSGIVDAIDKFDEELNSEKVIFVHPRQVTTLRKDSDFISADKYKAGVMLTGEIGMIANCRVVPSKKVSHLDITQGVRTITITTAATKDKEFTVTIGGKVYGVTDNTGTTTTTTTAGKIAAAITADTDATVTATSASAVVTLTEKTGYYGVALADEPVIAAGTSNVAATQAETTDGVAGFKNPIVKLNNDTETEEDAPALTVYLKRDTNVETDRVSLSRKTDISVDKHYSVALSNTAKVVLAKYKA